MTVIYSLYFGRNIPTEKQSIVGSKNVTNKMWKSFKNSVLDKYFEGYTIQDATGVWKGDTELTKIVTIVSFEDDLWKIQKITESYRVAFQQDCVMVVRQEAKVDFM
jgi:predicted PolB exonuclease-like 3'-5' exonuclease